MESLAGYDSRESVKDNRNDCFTASPVAEPLPSRDVVANLGASVTYRREEKGTKRGKVMLVDNSGYTYNINKQTDHATYWQCTARPKVDPCKASVTEKDGTFKAGKSSHNHKAKTEALKKKFKPAKAVVNEKMSTDIFSPPSRKRRKKENSDPHPSLSTQVKNMQISRNDSSSEDCSDSGFDTYTTPQDTSRNGDPLHSSVNIIRSPEPDDSNSEIQIPEEITSFIVGENGSRSVSQVHLMDVESRKEWLKQYDHEVVINPAESRLQGGVPCIFTFKPELKSDVNVKASFGNLEPIILEKTRRGYLGEIPASPKMTDGVIPVLLISTTTGKILAETSLDYCVELYERKNLDGKPGANDSRRREDGGNDGGASGGGASGGRASGGGASGGRASGGRASGGRASGGRASGGRASGGRASGGRSSGGRSSGGGSSGEGAGGSGVSGDGTGGTGAGGCGGKGCGTYGGGATGCQYRIEASQLGSDVVSKLCELIQKCSVGVQRQEPSATQNKACIEAEEDLEDDQLSCTQESNENYFADTEDCSSVSSETDSALSDSESWDESLSDSPLSFPLVNSRSSKSQEAILETESTQHSREAVYSKLNVSHEIQELMTEGFTSEDSIGNNNYVGSGVCHKWNTSLPESKKTEENCEKDDYNKMQDSSQEWAFSRALLLEPVPTQYLHNVINKETYVNHDFLPAIIEGEGLASWSDPCENEDAGKNELSRWEMLSTEPNKTDGGVEKDVFDSEEDLSREQGLFSEQGNSHVHLSLPDYTFVRSRCSFAGSFIMFHKNNPLCGAARNGHTNTVRLLIENGADVNKERDPPLSEAARNGHTDTVRLLIENGADVNKEEWILQHTPLTAAVTNGHTDIVWLLIQNGADVNKRSGILGHTPLTEAVINGHTDIVWLLIQNGAYVNKGRGILGQTLLTHAVTRGHTDIVWLLIQNGVYVNKGRGILGHTLLTEAVTKGHTDIVWLLIQNGANVNNRSGSDLRRKFEADARDAKLSLERELNIQLRGKKIASLPKRLGKKLKTQTEMTSPRDIVEEGKCGKDRMTDVELSPRCVQFKPFIMEESPGDSSIMHHDFKTINKRMDRVTSTYVGNAEQDHCVVVEKAKTHPNGDTIIIYGRKINEEGSGVGEVFRLATKNIKHTWDDEEVIAENVQIGSVVKYVQVGDKFLFQGNTKRPRWNMDKIFLDLSRADGAHRGFGDAFLNSKILAEDSYQDCTPKETSSFISLKCGVVENDRILVITELGELFNLKLNCRDAILPLYPSTLELSHEEDNKDAVDSAVMEMEEPLLISGVDGLSKPSYPVLGEGLNLRDEPKETLVEAENPEADPVEKDDENGNAF